MDNKEEVCVSILNPLCENAKMELPYCETIKAGFPSPAADYVTQGIDLNEVLIKNKAATFLARASGHSMCDAGIDDGDLLVVDKSLNPRNGCVAVCCLDGEFTLKRIEIKAKEVWLMPANDSYKPIRVTAENDFVVWGILTYVIKKF